MPINLKDILLRDTMVKSLDNDSESFQGVLDNVCTYVEVVHHAGYSPEMLQGAARVALLSGHILLMPVCLAVGIYLTSVARRAAERPQGAINPSPLIIMACTLIQHNKAQSRVCKIAVS